MPLRYYSYHVPGERRNGVLIVDSPNEVVKYWDFVYDEDTMENDLQGQCACGLDDWEEMLRMKGAVLTPMIWRSGACVQVRVGARVVVGVLITPSGCDTQFDHTTASYEVLVRPPPSGSDGEESDHPSQPQTTPSSPRRSPTLRIYFMSVLENLIAPGEILYLRHGSLANPEFKKPGKYLQVRLNVPNTLSPEAGRVYVTCHYYARTFGRPETIHLPSITMNVAPWDLILPASFRGRPEDVLEYLQPLPSPI